jgi:hypothetical protein
MGTPQKKISEFVDFHLRPHVEALPSHLKDTTDYLKKNGVYKLNMIKYDLFASGIVFLLQLYQYLFI